MSSMYNFVLLLCTASLLTHCASANEKRALQRWENEESQWEAASAVAPALGPDTGLDIYVRFALRNNRGLRSAFERWRAALEEIAPARTLADPRFTYGYFIDEVETRVGAQKQRFSLVQTFPWIGKLDLAGRAALQAAEVEQQRYEAAKLDLVYRVQEAYCEYYYLQKAVEITRENIQLMIFLEGVVRVKYKGGRGQHQALIKTQVELGKLEDRLGTLRDMMRPFAARLNAARLNAVSPAAVQRRAVTMQFQDT